MRLFLLTLFACLLIPAIALAAIPDLGADPLGFVTAFINAFVAHNWTLVAAFLVSALVLGIRLGLPKLPGLVKKPELAPKIDAILKSDPMGVAITWLSAFALALATASPAVFTFALCKQAAVYACGAMGVFSTLKKFALPLLNPLAKLALDWLTKKLGGSLGSEIASGIELSAASGAAKGEASAKASDVPASGLLGSIQ